MSNSSLKRTTEATICAIQEQAVTTRYIEKKIHKVTDNDRCRLCQSFPESIHHIINGCPSLCQNVYTTRHDNVAKYVYIKISSIAKLLETEQKWYNIQPECVIENDEYKIIWNTEIMTDHRIQHNKPDIVFVNKITHTAFIIDIAIPLDQNVIKKREEKLKNYTDLAIQLKQMWNLNDIKIVPIIIGSTATIHNRLMIDLAKLNIEFTRRDIINMQHIALLGTSYIWRHFKQLVN